MTLKELYEQISGDYDSAMELFQAETLLDAIIIKFIDDKSMNDLREAVENDDIEGSFRAIHTLKGVSANLRFTALMESAQKLTDQLRTLECQADEDLLAEVEMQYLLVINTLREYIDEK